MNKAQATLLAEFLGVEPMYRTESRQWFYEWKVGNNIRTFYFDEMNGLLPIIEKIEKIGENDTTYGTRVEITTTYIRICGEGALRITLDHKLKQFTDKTIGTLKAVYMYLKALKKQKACIHCGNERDDKSFPECPKCYKKVLLNEI